MTHTPELKPCPFCGGDAELDTMQGYLALSSGRLGNRATVYCTRCGADMGFCYEDAPGTPSEDIVNQVVDDWNRRAVNSLPALVKAREKRAEWHKCSCPEPCDDYGVFPGGCAGRYRQDYLALRAIVSHKTGDGQ